MNKNITAHLIELGIALEEKFNTNIINRSLEDLEALAYTKTGSDREMLLEFVLLAHRVNAM